MAQPVKLRGLRQLTCTRCGHTWWPRRPVIRACPACGSVRWNVPREDDPRWTRSSSDQGEGSGEG